VGHVHSVFSKAMNLQMGDELLTVADTRLMNLPYGLLCDFSEVNLRAEASPGQRVQVSRAGLWAREARLYIDFTQASIWSPPLHLPATLDEVGRIRSRLALVQRVAQAHGMPEGLVPLFGRVDALLNGCVNNEESLSPLARYGFHKIAILVRAVRRREAQAMVEAAKPLLGLGNGLTPSGDDVLLGVFVALMATAKVSDQSTVDAVCRTLAKLAEVHTTAVSQAWFRALHQGYVAERVGILLDHIVSGASEAKLRESTKCVLSFGATSGAETILGLLLGLSLALEWMETRDST